MALIRTLLAYFTMVVVTVVVGTPYMILCAIPAFRRRGFELFSWMWARGICGAAGARIEVSGLENIDPGRPVVFIGNHQSVFDIFAMIIALRPFHYRFTPKRELKKFPIVGWALVLTGFPFIDRRNTARSRVVMAALGERMRRTSLKVIFFPEGTRNRGKGLLPFKKGAFVMAIQLGIPIVPFVINGARAVKGRKDFLVRAGTIHVEFLPPIETVNMTYGDRDVLSDRARSAILANLEAAER